MSYAITFDPDTHIVEINIQGILTLNNAKEIFSEAIKLAVEKDTFLLLTDFCEAAINLSTLEFYELPNILESVATSIGVNVRAFKRAIVFSPTKFKNAGFAENIKVNRGHTIMHFQDSDEAKKWLSEK